MRDPRVEALARVLVRYSSAVKKGEVVVVRAETAAEPLSMAVYEEVLRAGGLPIVNLGMDGQAAAFFRLADEAQLDWVPPTAAWAAREADASIAIMADTNTRELSSVDPTRQTRRQIAMQPLSRTALERAAKGEYKWAMTLYPTNAYASEADMSLFEYSNFFFKACFADADDPVAEWRSQAEESKRLAEWIEGKEEVHIKAPGTDLKLGIAGRRFVVADGRHNMPDGEFFTGPVEDATEGVIAFSYPAIYGGREVSGVRLKFESGRVVDASADRNEEYLLEMLKTDQGAACLGELGIGTNYGIDRFTKEILLDEKIGGTVHLAVGTSYPETGGLNESAIHWDMVCDLRRGGSITVDGLPMQENGRFVV